MFAKAFSNALKISLISPELRPTAARRLLGNADSYSGLSKLGMATALSATASPEIPKYASIAKDKTGVNALRGLVSELPSMRHHGEDFAAFKLVEAAMREEEDFVNLPSVDFDPLWRQLMHINSDGQVRKAMSKWMAKTAFMRVKKLVGYGGSLHRLDSNDKIAALREAVERAAQAIQLEEATHTAGRITQYSWDDLERVVMNAYKRVWNYQAPSTLPAFLEDQAGLLTTLFEAFGRPADILVKQLIEDLTYYLEEKAIFALPWIFPVATKYNIDSTWLDEKAVRLAEIYREKLLEQPLETLSTNQADRIFASIASDVLKQAQQLTDKHQPSRDDYPEPDLFPIRLNSLPELFTRLQLSPEARQRLVLAIEEAAEIAAKKTSSKFSDYNDSSPFFHSILLENYAAWLFSSGLRPTVRNTEDLARIARGLQDPEKKYGWRWDLPLRQRAEVFGALASAAREASLSDEPVRQAWNVAQKRALLRAQEEANGASEKQAQALSDAVAAQARLDSARKYFTSMAQKVNDIQGVSVAW